VHGGAEIHGRRDHVMASSELALLSGAVALAIGGIGIVSAARARQRRAGEAPPSAPESSGKPELPDDPMGVPAQGSSGNGEVELPGFPRTDPTHG
jgi:hypothetical protein